MKVAFTKAIDFYPEWGGNLLQDKSEQVKIVLSPMEHEDFLTTIDRMRTISQGRTVEGLSAEELQKDASAQGLVIDLIKETGEFIPKYVTSVENLFGEDGPVTPEDLTKYSYFFMLTLEVLNYLIALSTPNEEEEKNLGTQPDLASPPLSETQPSS